MKKKNTTSLSKMIQTLDIPENKKQQIMDSLSNYERETARTALRLDRSIHEKNTLTMLLSRTSEDLEHSVASIKQMFGRYLSTEVMNSLLSDPSALKLGGERRTVTIMMTDLRGVTAVVERLNPEQVVNMLNIYFEEMVEIILRYGGTINEIIGDALLVIFGAPQRMEDRTQRAVACAIDMQNAMAEVNSTVKAHGLPALEMGIGLNESEVVVGNIGSEKRSKYAVVGSGVNLTSRIESYSVGGQILVSESVFEKTRGILNVECSQKTTLKGIESPLEVYSVIGIAGQYNLFLAPKEQEMKELKAPLHIRYGEMEGKTEAEALAEARLTALSGNSASIRSLVRIGPLTNITMSLSLPGNPLSWKRFYGKVLGHSEGESRIVRFTSVPPEVDAYFQALLQLSEQ